MASTTQARVEHDKQVISDVEIDDGDINVSDSEPEIEDVEEVPAGKVVTSSAASKATPSTGKVTLSPEVSKLKHTTPEAMKKASSPKAGPVATPSAPRRALQSDAG